RFEIKPEPGEQAVTLHLVAHDYSGATSGDAATKANVVWHRPRLERAGQPPRMLADYAEFAKDFELDYAALFAGSSRYLAASREAAHQPTVPLTDIAKRHGIDADWLRRWTETLDVRPLGDDGSPSRSAREPGRTVAAVPLESLDTKSPPNNERPTINGWQPAGAELPIVISNSGDETLHVPGRIGPHQVAMHPTPQQFVAAVWTSPIAGRVRIEATIAHAHPACGNGVAWWLELRRPQRAAVLAEGVLDLGKQTQAAVDEFNVAKGDAVLLAVDARDANHVCDLTEVAFQISAVGEDNTENSRVWNLAADVANNIQAGNPHADRFGNADVWRFVRGPAREVKSVETGPSIPADSIVGRWRAAAADPRRSDEAATLARQVESLLAGSRPAEDNAANRAAYDYLLSLDGPLLGGIEIARLAALARETSATANKNDAAPFALPRDRFVASENGNTDRLSLATRIGETLAIRLPATLFRDHVFIVEATVGPPQSARVVRCEVRMSPPDAGEPWDGQSPWLTSGDTATERLERGLADFRRLFPWFICYPHVIPLDEVVCLKTFHREDQPLIDLFLSDEQTAEIDRLWDNHRFISKFPVVENEYLPLFIGFVTQDQPKELLDYFESQREPFRQRAEAFEREFDAAAPMQLERLAEFAARAYRRPLTDVEAAELRSLYQTLRSKGVAHDEAFRGVLARVLVSPSFLFHLEQHPPGDQPQPVSDWELASRLSYFLWSSLPDDELRELAAAGRLHEPDVLAAQTRRMLTDDRVRALAVEFGTQWIHVRGFDQMNEKNERLFPTFNAELRTAMNEESVRFFQYLFQQDQPITHIVDADFAMLNETMARHYGIPDVAGDHWRRVDGVRAFGRGGILGLASVQSKQAGASRTSPVLRGNWVVETLLGERLPRPPANVPPLPEEETGNDGLTMRQLVEKHVRVESCANCHRRIDPFGFALERYDAIGRLRETDLGGLPVDSQVTLRDGTRFDGIDGLRDYLLGAKRDVFVRLFCRRLLGYALARETKLSDQPLIEEMVASLEQHDGRLSAAVRTIVQSPQFRMIRSQDQTEESPR
ncbi:MAG: DUF1592 domain-containing protein, partial [Planctomycetales bacterium]|nr:DUF1592 domain-containing protein [Planctomycetales bacterium]